MVAWSQLWDHGILRFQSHNCARILHNCSRVIHFFLYDVKVPDILIHYFYFVKSKYCRYLYETINKSSVYESNTLKIRLEMPEDAYFCRRFSAFRLALSLPLKFPPPFRDRQGCARVMWPSWSLLLPMALRTVMFVDVCKSHVLIRFDGLCLSPLCRSTSKEIRKSYGIIFVLHISQWPK